MPVPAVKLVVNGCKYRKAAFLISIAQSTSAGSFTDAYMLKFMMTGFHATDYFTAAGTPVENTIKHRHQVSKSVKMLVIVIMFTGSGQCSY
jgi:hypothetical protein